MIMNICDIIEEEYSSYVFRNKTLNTFAVFLNEERKISNDVLTTSNTISNIIFNDRRSFERQTIGTGKRIYFKLFKEIEIGNDSFIVKPTILIKIEISNKLAKGESSITPNTERPFIGDKLNKPIIIIRQYNTEPNIDRTLFDDTLNHEIMHGLRMLNIELKNRKDNGVRDTKRQNLYKIYSDIDSSEGSLITFVKEAYYITDIDEINANAAAEANHILLHKEINFANYKKFLDNIPFYDKIKEIQKKLSYIDVLVKNNEKNKIAFGIIISRIIYNNKYNDKPLIAFNKMYNRLRRTYTYCIRRFYDILWFALEKDNRDRVLPINQNKITQEELSRSLLEILQESNFPKKKK